MQLQIGNFSRNFFNIKLEISFRYTFLAVTIHGFLNNNPKSINKLTEIIFSNTSITINTIPERITKYAPVKQSKPDSNISKAF